MTVKVKAAVQPFQGVPWLHVNGKPFTGMTYLRAIERYPGFDNYSFDGVLAEYRQAARQGAGLFLFNSTCASDFYERLWGDVWVDPETWDFSHVDRFMEFFARECPDVWIMPKINMFLPLWWEAAHPEELQRFADGRTRARFGGESAAARDQVVSLASDVWYADMTRCLERYLDYIESKYGDRTVGFMICSGITHEWGILGSFDFVDYSEPMRRYWRQWVTARYGSAAPYAADTIPSPAQRLEAVGDYRDPSRSQASIDFQLCLSDLVVERISGFCETVKRKTAGNKVAATYYGYTLTCRESGLECLNQFLGRYGCGGFQGGHLAMRKLLRAPAVDMITSPFSYADRRLGTGDLQPHYAETSVVRAGKVSFLQDDNRSWKGRDQKGLDTGYYPESENFLRQLRRAFARRLCGDDQFYLMDLLGGTYDDPRVWAELQRLQQLFDRHAGLRGPSLAEALVVVDEAAIAHLSLESGVQMRNVYRQSVAWARMGVPFHVVLAEDAAGMDLAPYRFAIMANTVVATPAVAELVARCRQAGCSLLFLPGAGIVGPHGPDSAAALALTGVEPDGGRVTVREREGTPEFDAVAAAVPLGWEELGALAGLAGCHRYGDRGERIWRSPRLLGIHVNEGGSVSLRLPAGERVTEAVLAPGPWRQHGDRLELTCDAWETAVFTVASDREMK